MIESNTPKPGIKTTEFWLTLAAATFLGLTAVYTDEKWAQLAGVIGTALVAMGYGITRAKAKS